MMEVFITKVQAALIDIKLPERSIPDYSDSNNLDSLIARIVDYVFIVIGIGIFLAIFRSAYLMVSSQGDVAQFEKGKKGLLWSVSGLVVILLARFLMGVVFDLVVNNPTP